MFYSHIKFHMPTSLGVLDIPTKQNIIENIGKDAMFSFHVYSNLAATEKTSQYGKQQRTYRSRLIGACLSAGGLDIDLTA
jgi:hypothetical protein